MNTLSKLVTSSRIAPWGIGGKHLRVSMETLISTLSLVVTIIFHGSLLYVSTDGNTRFYTNVSYANIL